MKYVGAINGPVFFNTSVSTECVEVPRESKGKDRNCKKDNQVCGGTVLQLGESHVAFGYHCNNDDNLR